MPDVLRQQYEKLASCVRESGVLSDHAKTNHPLYESGVRFVTSPNKLSPTLKHYVCLVYDDIASLDTPNAASPMKETQLPIIHPPLPSSEPSSTPSSTSLTPPESSTPNDTSTATSTDTLETPPQEAVAKVSIPFSTEATPENEEELGDQSMTPSPPATSSTPREAETTPTSLPSTTPTPPATSSTLVDKVPSSAVNKVQYSNFRPDQESDFTFSLSSTLAATSPPMELDSTTPIPTTYEATSDTSDAEESGDSTVTPTTAASSTNGVTEEPVSTPVTLSEHTVASTQTVPTPFPSMSEEEVVVVPLDYLSVRLTTYPQSDYLPTLKPDSEAIHTTPMMYLTDLPEAHQADEPGTESLPSTVTGYPRTYLPETHEPMAETGTPITKHSTTSLPIETRPTAPSTVPTTPVSGSSTSINPPVLDGTEHVEGETKTRIPDQVTLPHNMDNEDEAIHSKLQDIYKSTTPEISTTGVPSHDSTTGMIVSTAPHEAEANETTMEPATSHEPTMDSTNITEPTTETTDSYEAAETIEPAAVPTSSHETQADEFPIFYDANITETTIEPITSQKTKATEPIASDTTAAITEPPSLTEITRPTVEPQADVTERTISQEADFTQLTSEPTTLRDTQITTPTVEPLISHEEAETTQTTLNETETEPTTEMKEDVTGTTFEHITTRQTTPHIPFYYAATTSHSTLASTTPTTPPIASVGPTLSDGHVNPAESTSVAIESDDEYTTSSTGSYISHRLSSETTLAITSVTPHPLAALMKQKPIPCDFSFMKYFFDHMSPPCRSELMRILTLSMNSSGVSVQRV
ncbi:hypothetical protein E2C01_029914 [Portunus trituberculatus]|uniref:Uncharacterized protein n=1 Tax=Portunus trituberculatus TaxID=210409 RepID=A0A5B7ETI0_PORTR|nr:hypothetical protein [Portunus trituberculatus]